MHARVTCPLFPARWPCRALSDEPVRHATRSSRSVTPNRWGVLHLLQSKLFLDAFDRARVAIIERVNMADSGAHPICASAGAISASGSSPRYQRERTPCRRGATCSSRMKSKRCGRTWPRSARTENADRSRDGFFAPGRYACRIGCARLRRAGHGDTDLFDPCRRGHVAAATSRLRSAAPAAHQRGCPRSPPSAPVQESLPTRPDRRRQAPWPWCSAARERTSRWRWPA